MFEQLTELVQKFGHEAVVQNEAVPNEQNNVVMDHASNSILESLKNIASQSGGAEMIGSLLNGNNASNPSNPAVKQITDELSGSLSEKFGLSPDQASGVAGGLIPKVLGSLVSGAKDPNNSSFNISDIIGSISGGNAATSGGIMDAVSKYGGQFGLDQNGDGKIDMGDAMAAVEKKGGFGAIIGKLFGK